MSKAAAIVAAAGSGLRMNSEVRKQYLCLDGLPILVRSLKLFIDHPEVEQVIAVIPRGEEKIVCDLVEPYLDFDRITMVTGGETRAESIYRGIEKLSSVCSMVCIHDAARPLASGKLLSELLAAASCCGAAIPAVPVSDTIKEIDEKSNVINTLPRSRLRAVQTPQVFQRELIVGAYRAAGQSGFKDATDDAALLERVGIAVKVVSGEPDNIKITTTRDLLLASLILKGAGPL